MKAKFTVICLTVLGFIFSFATPLMAQSDHVVVEEGEDGWRLLVNDEPLMVNGMNWDYFPIGTNYNYSIWNESPEFIMEALDNEMGLLQNMGVNAIRVYTGKYRKSGSNIYTTTMEFTPCLITHLGVTASQ